MKKIFSLALAVLMVLPMLMFQASADTVSADTSWYNPSASEFILMDAADLLGFSQISASTNFAGKTVKLGDDIVLNEGDAVTWSTQAPAISWTPAGRFAGTFDGQGYTISGVYCVGSTQVSFFKEIDGATVKNLSLVNSYFAATSGNNVAAFAQYCYGKITFDTIYTDAIISGAGYNAGGFVASMGSATEGHFKNLWFDGSVTLAVRYGAGIVANGEGKTLVAENCLNTGKIYTSHTAIPMAHIGGIIGRNNGHNTLINCANFGKVSSALTENGSPDDLGALLGANTSTETNADGSWKASVSIMNSCASTESCVKIIGANTSQDPSQVSDYTFISESLLKAYGAYVNTTMDFEKVWAVNLNGLPTLQIFTPADQIPALYEVNPPAVEAAQLKLEGRYGPRWTVSLKLPEGMTKDDVKLGALIVPTKAIPADHELSLGDSSFEYRGNDYEVANVEAKIFRESEEGTLVATFVITDLSAATARMSFTIVPYASYTVDGGATIDMYGNVEDYSFYQELVFSLETEDAAHKTKAEAVLAPIDARLGGRFPVSESWGKEDLFEEVPAMLVDGAEIKPSADCGAGNYVIYVQGTQDADYYAYLETLEAFGFEKVYDNGKEGIQDAVYNNTYKKGDLYLTVTQMCYMNRTFISANWNLLLSDHLEDKFSDDVKEGASTKLHVNELYNWGNSIVFQLKNGHFIINDGATDDELPYLLDYLETLVPEGEIPVVDAWFFSHLHYDHSCVVRPFLKNPDWIDRIRVNSFYFSEPSNTVKDYDPGVYSQIDEAKMAIKLLKTEDGGTPQIYRPQTGQRYYFSDVVVEILLSQEQLPLNEYYGRYTPGNFNESSTWLRYVIGDQDVVIAGDSDHGGMNVIMRSYDREFMDMDVFFSVHHGVNTWDDFTNYCTFHTVIHPYTNMVQNNENKNLNQAALDNGGEYLVEGDGTLVLTFPYTVGSFERLPKRAWIYHGQPAREPSLQ